MFYNAAVIRESFREAANGLFINTLARGRLRAVEKKFGSDARRSCCLILLGFSLHPGKDEEVAKYFANLVRKKQLKIQTEKWPPAFAYTNDQGELIALYEDRQTSKHNRSEGLLELGFGTPAKPIIETPLTPHIVDMAQYLHSFFPFSPLAVIFSCLGRHPIGAKYGVSTHLANAANNTVKILFPEL